MDFHSDTRIKQFKIITCMHISLQIYVFTYYWNSNCFSIFPQIFIVFQQMQLIKGFFKWKKTQTKTKALFTTKSIPQNILVI